MQGQPQYNLFLTIEGIEGVGKSTAIKYIQKYLTKAQQEFVITREPGGTPIAERIRKVLLAPDTDEAIAPETELLLMFACRAQHINNLIKPALAAGKWVVSDRFVDSTYAYQGAGRELDLNQIEMLDRYVVGDLRPDATILLDAPPALSLARTKNRHTQDRIEQEKIDFFDRVRDAYFQRAKLDPKRFYIINGLKPLHAVHEEIGIILDEIILGKKSEK